MFWKACDANAATNIRVYTRWQWEWLMQCLKDILGYTNHILAGRYVFQNNYKFVTAESGEKVSFSQFGTNSLCDSN